MKGLEEVEGEEKGVREMEREGREEQRRENKMNTRGGGNSKVDGWAETVRGI